MPEKQEVKQEGLLITADVLKEMLTSAIAAAKAPNSVEQKKLDAEEQKIKQAQDDRIRLSQTLIADKEQQRLIQRTCSHEHSRGDSHCVYVMEKGTPGYFLCQKNQCIIRPGLEPANYKGNAIFDNALFNKLFQKQSGNEIFG
jgi:hypothetical protein